MNKFTNERWDYYSYSPENIALNGTEYAVKLSGGKEDGSDDRAVTNSEEIARLIVNAPEMYRALKDILSKEDKISAASAGVWSLINDARRLLARIDGEQEEKS